MHVDHVTAASLADAGCWPYIAHDAYVTGRASPNQVSASDDRHCPDVPSPWGAGFSEECTMTTGGSEGTWKGWSAKASELRAAGLDITESIYVRYSLVFYCRTSSINLKLPTWVSILQTITTP
jgi:hypothetical protein